MKYKYIFSILIIPLLCCCEKENNLTQLYVDQITYGDCKQGTTKSENAEYIEYRTVNNSYLQIKHINVWFNCEPGQLLVDVDLDIDTIVVDENEESSLANCVCPYDLCYLIGPMAHAQYIIVIQRSGYLYTQFSVDFNSSTAGVFEVD